MMTSERGRRGLPASAGSLSCRRRRQRTGRRTRATVVETISSSALITVLLTQIIGFIFTCRPLGSP